jgi:hypothetical protein
VAQLAEYRMNVEDLRAPSARLHNFRVTALWTDCTSLTNKRLTMHEFH